MNKSQQELVDWCHEFYASNRHLRGDPCRCTKLISPHSQDIHTYAKYKKYKKKIAHACEQLDYYGVQKSNYVMEDRYIVLLHLLQDKQDLYLSNIKYKHFLKI